jgi:hypothetical protein
VREHLLEWRQGRLGVHGVRCNILPWDSDADGRETLETRYVSRAEAAQLRCSPHVSHVLDIAFQAGSTAYFDPPTWRPVPA